MPTALTARFLRINANNTEIPMAFVNVSEDDLKNDRLYTSLKQQFQSHTPHGIERSKYEFWCKNAEGVMKRYKAEIYYDDSGLQKVDTVARNHRMMAMVGAGKYKDYKTFRNVDENSRSQQIQMTSGQTEWVGDVIIRFKEGSPLPDIEFFGESPHGWLSTRWFAEGWSSKTKNRNYGKDSARLRACLGVKERWYEAVQANGNMMNNALLEPLRRNPLFYEAIWVEHDSFNVLNCEGVSDDESPSEDSDSDDGDGMNCVLCDGKYQHMGNNPHPLSETGRCCNDCNATKVIIARMAM